MSGDTYEKWKPIIESLGLPNENHKSWLSEYMQNNCYFDPSLTSGITSTNSTSFPNLLPIAMKVAATTIGFGGWYKSKKQQQKEKRLNKIRKIQGLEPNIVLRDDLYQDGLVSVTPMSVPTGQFFYSNYKYESIKSIRKKKLNKINRMMKLKYIDEILKNNT